MKIVSWNVNGLRAVHRKGLFVPFLVYGFLLGTAGISQSVYGMLGAQLAGAIAAWFLLNRQLGSRVFGVLRSDSRS